MRQFLDSDYNKERKKNKLIEKQKKEKNELENIYILPKTKELTN